MFSSKNNSNSTSTSTYSSTPSDTLFVMMTPSIHSESTTTHSSKVASFKSSRRAYKQVLAKLHAGLTLFKPKTKKTKKFATGGQLAPVAADAPAEKLGHPTRAVELPDAYYGWEYASKTSAEYIVKLFNCSPILPEDGYPELGEFIAYALFIFQVDSRANDYALSLLSKLKMAHPDFQPVCGHAIYLAALTLAAKMTGHGYVSPECCMMAGQWMFTTAQIELNEQFLGDLLCWDLDVNHEQIESTREHVRVGREPDVEPVPLTPEYDDDTSSIYSIDSCSSLSTCSILSTWSLHSMRGWDESTHNDSAITTAPGEKVNTSPYGDVEIWRSLRTSHPSKQPRPPWGSVTADGSVNNPVNPVIARLVRFIADAS
ncbi:Cyclin, N-terminal domain, partial [Rhizoctonia solani]